MFFLARMIFLIFIHGRASRAPEGAAEYWCYKKIFQTLRTIYFYEQSLSFWIFSSSFKTFKIPNFCQKRSLSSFSPSGRLTQWSKFAFLRLSILKVSKTFTFVKRGLWIVFHQQGGLQNEQSLIFWVFQVLEISPSGQLTFCLFEFFKPWTSKDPTFVKRCLWAVFHQTSSSFSAF